MNREYDYLYVEQTPYKKKAIRIEYYDNQELNKTKQIKIIILLIIGGIVTIGICGIMGLMCGICI